MSLVNIVLSPGIDLLFYGSPCPLWWLLVLILIYFCANTLWVKEVGSENAMWLFPKATLSWINAQSISETELTNECNRVNKVVLQLREIVHVLVIREIGTNGIPGGWMSGMCGVQECWNWHTNNERASAQQCQTGMKLEMQLVIE